jgi:hypothetical protein
MKKTIVVMVFLIGVLIGNAQTSAKYYFGNSTISQNLSVKWLSDKKISFTYTIKDKKKTTTYKGIASTKGGDIESDEDVDGAYDVDEYTYKLKNCEIYIRIANDKSKVKIKSGGCPNTVSVSSIDKMIKL